MTARLKKGAAKAAKIAKANKVAVSGEFAAIAALPEPSRTAYALFQAVEMDAMELAELADVRSTAALAEILTKARKALQPEGNFPVDALLPLHIPWGHDLPAVEKALGNVSEKTAEELKAQIALDEAWQSKVEQVEMPEGLEPPVPSSIPPATHSLARNPAVIAIIVALGVMVGAIVFIAKERMEEFPGRELVSEVVADGVEVPDNQLEDIPPEEVGQLADWFLLKGFDEFTPPEELKTLKAVACRVYRHEGMPVAHILLEMRDAQLFIYPSARLKPRVESRAWVSYQQDDWAIAARSDDEFTYIIALPGYLADLPDFLKKGK